MYFEVDLEYPKKLHDLHNEYPLAPERIEINKVEKLIPNSNEKKKYVLHHKNLKQYLDLGLKLTKIHRGISLDEKAWLKPYIELNTNLRSKAQNEFEKDFFQTHEQQRLWQDDGKYLQPGEYSADQ